MRSADLRPVWYAVTIGLGVAALLSTTVQAAMVISSDATSNVTCNAGVCSATAADSVLNVTDLTNMLAAGSLTVQSGSQAQDILVEAPFSWSSSNALTLDSYRAVTVDKSVSDAGLAALNIAYNDGGIGGELLFRYKGRISFASIKNALAINGQGYKLFKDVASLAIAISGTPSGFYALKDNYNAAQDGTYPDSPITTTFTGTFEGLGNTIFNVSLHSGKGEKHEYLYLGFFSTVSSSGVVKNLRLSNIAYIDESPRSFFGGLAGVNQGLLFDDRASGRIFGNAHVHKYPQFVGAGGLVGWNDHSGTVANCSANVEVNAKYGSVGGLVAEIGGPISESFATGKVSGIEAGGLLANNDYGDILNSYSTGAVTGGPGGFVGGLLGLDQGDASGTYSIGKVTAPGPYGGYVGQPSAMPYVSAYWDTKTSGTNNGTSNGNAPGLIGLTTKQFKSGLPDGFDPTVWAQDPKINKGFPYLIANPPME